MLNYYEVEEIIDSNRQVLTAIVRNSIMYLYKDKCIFGLELGRSLQNENI